MRDHDPIIERWLKAENDGRDDAAEQALRAAFSGLPQTSPTAGFADRVLASIAAGVSTATPRTAAAFSPWWGRAATAACLLLAGLSAALSLSVVGSLARIIAPGEAIGVLVRGFVGLAGRIDDLLSLWHGWARLVDTVLLVASAPPVVVSLLTLTALSALTFRGLRRALVPYRSPDHVAA